MDKTAKHFYFWEVFGCVHAFVGVLLFFGSMMFVNDLNPTPFAILWLVGMAFMVSGLIIAGVNSSKRKQLEHKDFLNTYTHCPHCAGTGWVRKEK